MNPETVRVKLLTGTATGAEAVINVEDYNADHHEKLKALKPSKPAKEEKATAPPQEEPPAPLATEMVPPPPVPPSTPPAAVKPGRKPGRGRKGSK